MFKKKISLQWESNKKHKNSVKWDVTPVCMFSRNRAKSEILTQSYPKVLKYWDT